MKTLVLIEKGADGRFGVFSADLVSTIIGEGDSVAEAKLDFENSYKEVMQAYIECGEDVPEELCDLEFEYKFDIASLFNYFDFINVSKLAKKIGINASLLRQYKMGGTYISEAQAKKISDALRQVGAELATITL